MRNPVNGAVAELSLHQHAVLTACEGCRTLDEHMATVRRKLGVHEADVATLSGWLAEFASGGLLTPLDDLVNRFDPAPEWEAAPFAGITIRTCDRPELLARALASATALEARFKARYRYQVLDDSRDAANRAANRHAIADAKLDCKYTDLSAEDALIEELVGAFPAAKDEISWLLGGPTVDEATYGRPINAALILTAGRRSLLLDDDALLEARHPPASDAGFTVSSGRDELYCFAERAELERACPLAGIDPVAAHLESLGEPLGSLWTRLARAAPAQVDLVSDDARRFARDAKVLMTQNHALGDPGSSLFPYHLLSLPPASREQLRLEPGRMEYAFTRRINWRGQRRLRLTPNRPLTFTTMAGLDNSNLLPPTVRAHRNEDLLLGEMIRHVHPSAWFLDLPWGLPHWRSPIKVWIDRSASFPQEPVHFLLDYLGQAAHTIVSELARDRMRAFGAILLDLAAASERQLAELLEQQAADAAGRVQFEINELLDDAGVAAEWKALLRPWLGSPTLSTDPVTLRGRLAPAAEVRNLAKNYGRALDVWPAIWEWARMRQRSAGAG